MHYRIEEFELRSGDGRLFVCNLDIELEIGTDHTNWWIEGCKLHTVQSGKPVRIPLDDPAVHLAHPIFAAMWAQIENQVHADYDSRIRDRLADEYDPEGEDADHYYDTRDERVGQEYYS